MAGTFEELASRVFDLYERGAYREALDLIDREGPRFPVEAWHIAFWRLCLLARLGDVPGALSHLEQFLASGLWFPVSMLRNDPDLAGLQGHPAFQRAVAVCQRRHREAQDKATSFRIFLQPETITARDAEGPVPLLIALHGNGENARRAAERWRFATSLGWALLVPQSTQVMGPDAYGWDDLERGGEEVLAHCRSLQAEGAVDAGRVVVAGFSRGAALAVYLALSGRLPVCGFIAVAPHLPSWDHLKQYLSPRGAHPASKATLGDVRGHFIAGAGDERAVRMSQDVAGWMRAAGLHARVEVLESMGHFYPPDLPDRVAPLLADWR